MKRLRAVAVIFSLLWLGACGTRETVNTVLFNGKIVTLDGESTIAEAIAIKDDRIIAVGRDEEMLALAAAKRIDPGAKPSSLVSLTTTTTALAVGPVWICRAPGA